MKNNQETTETVSECAKLLIELELTLGFAESATCGYIAYAFSLVEGAGQFLKGGIFCYDASIKESLLKVDKKLIDQYTPESAAVTKAITEGLAPLLNCDISIGCTGLTCPGGSETAKKPVGTMFLHATHAHKTVFASRTVFSGNQQEIVASATHQAAQQLLFYLRHLKDQRQKTLANNQDSSGEIDEWSVSWP